LLLLGSVEPHVAFSSLHTLAAHLAVIETLFEVFTRHHFDKARSFAAGQELIAPFASAIATYFDAVS
jgi:hypothetical protein